MADASGTETKTDTQPLVIAPVAGPFKTDTTIERDPVVFTMEDVVITESPRYKFVPSPNVDDKAFVGGHFEPTGETTTHKTTRRSTYTLSPMKFKSSEIFDDTHRFPMVAGGKAPCGCQDAEVTPAKGKGLDVMSILMGGLAALAPQLLPMLSGLFGGGKQTSSSHVYAAGIPTLWETYCEEKGLDTTDANQSGEHVKDFQAWVAAKADASKSDPDPSTEH